MEHRSPGLVAFDGFTMAGDPPLKEGYQRDRDDLLKRHLPVSVQQQVQRAIQHRLPGAQRLGTVAMRVRQSLAKRKAETLRVNVARMDTWIEESLSFTGREAG